MQLEKSDTIGYSGWRQSKKTYLPPCTTRDTNGVFTASAATAAAIDASLMDK